MVFAAQHSIMARRWFKERWTKIVPPAIERSTYVLCASLALLLLFWQWRPIGIQVWSVENAAVRAILWTLFAAGWATVLAMTFYINHFDLFGLRQVWLPLIGKPYTRIAFRTPLPYRFVRHPLYFGFLLAFWMTPEMTLAHLVFALATTAYIVMAIQFEERDLVAEHGPAYEQYRRSVPMLLPGRTLKACQLERSVRLGGISPNGEDNRHRRRPIWRTGAGCPVSFVRRWWGQGRCWSGTVAISLTPVHAPGGKRRCALPSIAVGKRVPCVRSRVRLSFCPKIEARRSRPDGSCGNRSNSYFTFEWSLTFTLKKRACG